MDVTKYGRWEREDLFVFDPPLLRDGVIIEDLDLTTVTSLREGATREEMVVAVLRGQVTFNPARLAKPALRQFADKIGGQVDAVYTGKTKLPGGRVISCVVCGRTSQTRAPEKPDEIVLCCAPCAKAFEADPQRYLTKGESQK